MAVIVERCPHGVACSFAWACLVGDVLCSLQYGTGSLINYCILAANAVLSWPNDGMIEQKRSDLDGGHNMGHYKGECHSVNMRDPPICKNHERNALLNILAAR